MSGAGENRAWRRSTQGNRQNQDRSSGTNTPTRDGNRQQAMNALSGNVWGTGKGKGGGGNPTPQAPPPAPAEQHVPVRDFNAAEVKDALKKRYLEAVGGAFARKPQGQAIVYSSSRDTFAADQSSSVFHKVHGDSVPKRSSGAWGSRGNMPHQMPNGQDFFTQLKKQLQAMEQGKSS